MGIPICISVTEQLQTRIAIIWALEERMSLGVYNINTSTYAYSLTPNAKKLKAKSEYSES